MFPRRDLLQHLQFVEGSGERLDVINPATKEKIASVHVAGKKEVDAAVDAAEKAWPAWADSPPEVRAKAMHKLADLVEENAEALAAVQTSEMGRLFAEAMFVLIKKFSPLEYLLIHESSSQV